MEITNTKTSLRGGEPQLVGTIVKNEANTLLIQLALTRIQLSYQPEGYIAIQEDMDWWVVMQCLEDHGILNSHNKRPPIAELMRLLQQCDLLEVSSMLTQPNSDPLSQANQRAQGERYPWNNFTDQLLLRFRPRWRALYDYLDKILTDYGL